nr:immunoglobulin heavy chain junction region [Macaca mulatta]MOY21885.1 immunoglobulin heavy chain junction region [Macaca mulatta]MOY22756.1 immunoglobulin heavy chain junction region [Macaca mulatta]MOY22765.1 immunoglobulin heavy chain junction region [Macaca mulatta]MOY23933.1 immunoglobulin heavy chain junction region [Macaca mulatta]
CTRHIWYNHYFDYW